MSFQVGVHAGRMDGIASDVGGHIGANQASQGGYSANHADLHSMAYGAGTSQDIDWANAHNRDLDGNIESMVRLRSGQMEVADNGRATCSKFISALS